MVNVEAELAILGPLTDTTNPIKRRDADIDPLLLAAAFSSGPHVTRNHYAHDFFPGVGDPRAQGAWDWTMFTGEPKQPLTVEGPTYVSQQAPRSVRLGHQKFDDTLNPSKSDNLSSKRYHKNVINPSVDVQCMARTRIPTPYGPAFLHLYKNNRDSKEHLAIVMDPIQYEDLSQCGIRSASLDSVWDGETERDRLVRGAYVGKLGADTEKQIPSSPSHTPSSSTEGLTPPLIRVHSECFTGETIGSMRCDCGEQLDEALRLISLSTSPSTPGRGVVIYLRQEGRGIGLLSKIHAYNLQDMGHDTVSANLALGYGADERGYDIAGAILRDLRIADNGVRLLTNNVDKVGSLEKEGVRVVERVPMVPRSWRGDENGGDTMIGGKVHGEDLDKYLRTKVMKMGHLLPLVHS